MTQFVAAIGVQPSEQCLPFPAVTVEQPQHWLTVPSPILMCCNWDLMVAADLSFPVSPGLRGPLTGRGEGPGGSSFASDELNRSS